MSNIRDNKLEEWKQCIFLLDKFEDRLDAVRRYGFTFIAGLLSADAILGQVSGVVVNLSVKIAVLWIAAFLILILRVLDRDYQLLQRVIGNRARELEKDSGMSLERDILENYVKLGIWRFTLALYYGFECLVLLLGLAIVWGNMELELLAILGPLITIASIYSIEIGVKKSEKPSRQPGIRSIV